ncbi:MAG: long-chain fatty acid--CoA ligase [Candidatus Aminicenantes bacterium]|nr:long-chain fatty acid--CoA ligase [Candidatus Aminicenantes bacterium]NLH75788.1 long-chain fatty acid--CoA ligase [Acidobacteriota bacterium]
MVNTLAELIVHSVKSYPKPDFMLVKKDGVYTPISTAEFGADVEHLALGLRALGFQPGQKLCLLSENRPAWTMTDLATLCAGGLTVPIYTTLVPEQIRYIVDDSDATIVVVSNADHWKKVEPLRTVLSKVRHYITFAETAPAGVLTLASVLEKGRELAAKEPDLYEAMVARVRPEDEATLIYTSGTTGVPKGVILTHDNLVSNIRTSAEIIQISSEDTALSFLPLSHVLERMVMFTYLYKGSTVAFAESVEAVAQNLLEVRPHIMVSVPRVFEKIYTKVMDQVLASPSLRRKIFFWALGVGKAASAIELAGRPVPGGLAFRRRIAAKLVFSKVIAKTGGRVRLFVSGGAPLSKDIAEFFYALGLTILEGYGLTETSPVISINAFGATRLGTVGKVIPGVEVKIAEDGEILARGPNVMKGYYKKEAETREVMEGGWFHTGDIGQLDADGFLAITDRKKDLLVTSGGKNIAPQPIENLLKSSPYITNAVVLGDRQRFIAALVVPDFDKLRDYAKSQGIPFGTIEELCKDRRVVDFLKSEVDRATPQLASYERVKKIAVLHRDFDIERGEITPSLKVRRANVTSEYRDAIDALYREDGEEGRDDGTIGG